jgi:hypothetical protein
MRDLGKVLDLARGVVALAAPADHVPVGSAGLVLDILVIVVIEILIILRLLGGRGGLHVLNEELVVLGIAGGVVV